MTATRCSPGSFAAEVAQAACSRCEDGSYQPEGGRTRCVDCDLGHFCSTSAQYACPQGTWNELPMQLFSSACRSCPDKATSKPGSRSLDDCSCNPSYYKAAGGSCLGCPIGSGALLATSLCKYGKYSKYSHYGYYSHYSQQSTTSCSLLSDHTGFCPILTSAPITSQPLPAHNSPFIPHSTATSVS